MARATSPRAAAIKAGSPSSKAASRYSAMASALSRYSAESHSVVLRTIRPLLCQLLCLGYIGLLRLLAASGEQQNKHTSPLLKIDPVTRPIVDPQFADAITDGLYVSEVAQRQAANPDQDARPRLFVAQSA